MTQKISELDETKEILSLETVKVLSSLFLLSFLFSFFLFLFGFKTKSNVNQKVEERDYLLLQHEDYEEKLKQETKSVSDSLDRATHHISGLEGKVYFYLIFCFSFFCFSFESFSLYFSFCRLQDKKEYFRKTSKKEKDFGLCYQNNLTKFMMKFARTILIRPNFNENFRFFISFLSLFFFISSFSFKNHRQQILTNNTTGWVQKDWGTSRPRCTESKRKHSSIARFSFQIS